MRSHKSYNIDRKSSGLIVESNPDKLPREEVWAEQMMMFSRRSVIRASWRVRKKNRPGQGKFGRVAASSEVTQSHKLLTDLARSVEENEIECAIDSKLLEPLPVYQKKGTFPYWWKHRVAKRRAERVEAEERQKRLDDLLGEEAQ